MKTTQQTNALKKMKNERNNVGVGVNKNCISLDHRNNRMNTRNQTLAVVTNLITSANSRLEVSFMLLKTSETSISFIQK